MYEQLIAKGYPEWLAKLIYEAAEEAIKAPKLFTDKPERK